MKLTEKYSPSEMTVSPWAVYSECSIFIGAILDDKFEKAHLDIYEHTRHTTSEVFFHPALENEISIERVVGAPELSEEENELLSIVRVNESCRRANVIGDVGVGKSTFLTHLIELHIGKGAFGSGAAIYLDWSDFTASIADPIPEIHARFISHVTAALEDRFGGDALRKLDDVIFLTAKVFSNDRINIGRYPKTKQNGRIAEAIEKAIERFPLDMVFERLNALCRDNLNNLILIVDNIDHLHGSVLEQLRAFLTEIQLRATPLLVVAMRDHTFESGRSAYRPDRAVPTWHIRLKPPNLRKLLERRINYFVPLVAGESKSRFFNISDAGFRGHRDAATICRTLLSAPLSDPDTYEFLNNYSNYNIRELFCVMQSILSFPGFSGFGRRLLLAEEPNLYLGIDRCLVALGLGSQRIFFPEKSELFNPYSAGSDVNATDKIVAVRVIQLLANLKSPISFGELEARFQKWGYNHRAFEVQVRAMMNKDLIWSSTGVPENVCKESKLRLSYRGVLYGNALLPRTIFNYMMSFDVEAPNESHAVFRHRPPDFDNELTRLSTFDAVIDANDVAYRVLGLADVIFEAERAEIDGLTKRNLVGRFRDDVAPKPACLEIINGLSKYLIKASQSESKLNVQAPTTAMLKTVGEAKIAYESALSEYWA